MRYTLLLHWPELEPDSLSDEQLQEGQAAFHAYVRDLHAAGVLVSADVLKPSNASTTVTMNGGSMRIQDGPFAETREQIGGVFVLDVPDLDGALAWAEKCPSAQWGVVEIRPTAIHVEDGEWVGNG